MPPSVSDVTVSPAEKETRLSFSPCPQRKQHGDVTSYRRKVRKKVWSGAKKSMEMLEQLSWVLPRAGCFRDDQHERQRCIVIEYTSLRLTLKKLP